ncbi:hypothetical protein Bca52824_068792 [Brassica carinata]|uniref:Uncharacterized protein n=1 Tax=Brassica carinata TaxID=52824 RepID=A0A8X7Q2E4_BRACI|nr:hypothetical protein Bca52824_068792 [Brassica carinata]
MQWSNGEVHPTARSTDCGGTIDYKRRKDRCSGPSFLLFVSSWSRDSHTGDDSEVARGALGWLMSVPGASNTLLEAVVPYSKISMVQLLGRVPSQHCSQAMANEMALLAYNRAVKLSKPASQVFSHRGLYCIPPRRVRWLAAYGSCSGWLPQSSLLLSTGPQTGRNDLP